MIPASRISLVSTCGAKLCLDQVLGRVSTGEVAKPAAGGMAVPDCDLCLQSGARDAPACGAGMSSRALAARVQAETKDRNESGSTKTDGADALRSAIGEFFSRLFSRCGSLPTNPKAFSDKPLRSSRYNSENNLRFSARGNPRNRSTNGSPIPASFFSSRSVQSHSPQAHASDPFSSRQFRRSCAF